MVTIPPDQVVARTFYDPVTKKQITIGITARDAVLFRLLQEIAEALRRSK